MSNSLATSRTTRLPCPWYFPGKNTGGGCHFFLIQRCTLDVLFMVLDKCLMTSINYYDVIQSSYSALEILCALPIYIIPPPIHGNTDLFVFSIILLFSECLIVGHIQYVTFLDQPLDLVVCI